MSSLLLRDQIIRQCWVPADFRVPDPDVRGPHFPVQVWAVVEVNNRRFVDLVSWWPALRRWTATWQSKANEDAVEFAVVVVFWQPSPPLPLN